MEHHAPRLSADRASTNISSFSLNIKTVLETMTFVLCLDVGSPVFGVKRLINPVYDRAIRGQ